MDDTKKDVKTMDFIQTRDKTKLCVRILSEPLTLHKHGKLIAFGDLEDDGDDDNNIT